ncbi:DMT family transporter [Paraglaciecola aquimarina]|uniref:DMT family transporter n=1 Tax=Paraglaciecola algarum TaxID=3050085 RepID=A0ABS9D5M9_9ALTE|nr:DMT family transporter [Paraglaciecola sp. G1-23]MCF2948215.1 DMT family transporter [Paraglaciecola sp. G1-23]
MKVAIAYLTVVLVWSTTPLGLAWSSESVHPSMAGFLRMAIALVLGSVLLRFWRIKLPLDGQAFKLYAYSSIGLFGGMFASYLAAAYISTGMMSLAFGMSPIVTGVLAYKLLDEPKMGIRKWLAISISVIGMCIVFSDKVNVADNAWIGMLLIAFGVVSFSFSAVLIKTVRIQIHPAATMVGSMLIATPLYLMTWLIMDGTLPTETWSVKSLMSIVYLGVFGSLIGFICYFYVLQKLTTSSVSLITMMTPVFAILLGNGLNNEAITLNVVIGASAIIFGLALYQQRIRKPKVVLQN